MLANIKKRFKITVPARASIWYTATSALERGVNFIFTPIFTRALTPEEYGLYPLYVSFMGLFTVFVTLELTGNVIYRGLTKFDDRKEEFISASLGLMTLSVSAVILSFFLFENLFLRFTGLTRDIFIFLVLQTFINGVLNLYFAECRYSYKYKSPSLINTIFAILSPGLSFLLINFTRVRAEARIIAPFLVSAIIAIPIIVNMIRKGGRLFSRDIWHFLLKFNLPLLPHFFAATVIAQSGKIIIGRYFGEGELAKYSVVFSMGFLFSLITAGINSALTPWINRKLASGEGQKILYTVERLFVLFALLTLAGLCYSPEGLAFLAPEEYHSALGAVYPISLSVLVGFLTTIINAVLLYYEKSYLVTLSSVLSAGANLLLGFTLTSKYGYIAAAFVQLVSALVLLVLSAFTLRGVLKKRRIYPWKYLCTMIFTSLFAALLFAMRDVFISRVILFIALLAMTIPKVFECKDLIIDKRTG